MSRNQRYVGDHMARAGAVDSQGTVVHFPSYGAASSRYDGSVAFSLLSQLAEAVASIQNRAAETETQFRALAEGAIEKLELAAARVDSAEAARRAALETLAGVSARLKETERELTQARAQITAMEAQLANAEQVRQAAEARAINAERLVKQIEQAIDTQLGGLKRNLTRGSSRAA